MTPTTETFFLAGGTFSGSATPQMQFRVTARFQSRQTNMIYRGTAVANTIEEALEKAVFEALVTRATQFNTWKRDVGFRPVDELTPLLDNINKG